MNSDKEQISAMKTSAITLIVNIALSAFKLVAGIIAQSGAMISDAVHSASDVFSTFVVMIGLRMSSKESDTDHQYGHERLECIAAAFLSVILLATGFAIVYSSLSKIIAGNYDDLAMPGALALWAAVISIIVKEWMYHFTKSIAIRDNSPSLLADAWHHRSDALSSIGSFVGIFGAMMGFKVLDSLAGFVISLFIMKAGFDILRSTIDQMVDKACDANTERLIENIIRNTNGVGRLDSLKTRMFGSKMYVDVEISADGNMTLSEAHAIAEDVHLKIENELKEVKHCMVHVNPMEE